MKQESPNFSPKLPRRELFKLSGAALGTILLGGCNVAPLSELQSSSTPTREPTRTWAPEPTKAPTPEPSRLIETIKIAIPDLTVERYAAKFEDITSEVSESYKGDLQRWLTLSEFDQEESRYYPYPGYNFSFALRRCGLSVGGFDRIRPNNELEVFYFNGGEGRFHTLELSKPGIEEFLKTKGKDWCTVPKIGDEDKRILNWESGFGDEVIPFDLSCDGKILYRVSKKPLGPYITTIIADIPHATKTIIKDSKSRAIGSELSDDGNKLLLSLGKDKDFHGGTYLVNLNDWQIQFHINESSDQGLLNEDGSLLYLGADSYIVEGNMVIGEKQIGYKYDTITGVKTTIEWPYFLTSYGHWGSRNLHYIARKLGMFSSEKTEPGQWGTVIQTPNGMFMISSPQKSLSPSGIDNNGTIHTYSGDVFEFKDGTYKLVKTGDGKSIEVNVVKLGGG